MKVYISASPEVNNDLYNGVCALLTSTSGEIEFIPKGQLSTDFMSLVNPDFHSKEKFDDLEFTYIINHIKTKNDIFHDCHIILLTNKTILSPQQRMFDYPILIKHSIININDLPTTTDNHVNYIAYKCLEDLFVNLDVRLKFGSKFKIGAGHGSHIGCLGDKSRYVKNSVVNYHVCSNKIRVADICSRCVAIISENYSFQFISQICSLMEKIRGNITIGDWLKNKVRPEKLIIDMNGLITIGSVHFKIQDRLTALYILLLKHKSGIDTFSLSDYRDELHEIYKVLRGVKKNVKNTGLLKIIDNLCNISARDSKGKIIAKDNKEFRNAIHEINRELKSHLGETLSSFYEVKLFKSSSEGNYYQSVLSNDLIDIDPLFI